ncbi:BgTH12-03879 [Blumeria graminis f. sp. triticale]|uniref:Bgt-51067 n=2 Tax=Blumeria graminis TaxID=34373 RepID=A0A9X9L8X1_BLUGR|nr:BgTH12-03879 [Blumeria graminis f. sp. triticale]VCU39940.1 Bgt-51067 [Blumeria graminis f. sp. tritici]
MICYERWLFKFIMLAMLSTVTISVRRFTALDQKKDLLPTVPSLFHGITCN